MKRIFAFAMCCCLVMACSKKASNDNEQETAQGPVVINVENFPDENFRAAVCYLLSAEEGDTVPAERFAKVEELELERLWLNDLKGIEYFTALKQLDCSDNLLTSIDVSKNTALEYLECGRNLLTAIDVTHNHQLIGLGCSNNQLTSIDVSKNPELKDLLCNENMLESIDVSNNPKLLKLGVNECRLKALDVSKNQELSELYCTKNLFKELDLSNNTKLVNLYCEQPFFGHINITRPADKPNIGLGTTHTWSNSLHLYWDGTSEVFDLPDKIQLTQRERPSELISNDSLNFETAIALIDDVISEFSKIRIREASDTLKFLELKEKYESEEIMFLPEFDREGLSHTQRVHALRSMLKLLNETQRVAKEALATTGKGLEDIDLSEITEIRTAFEEALRNETR